MKKVSATLAFVMLCIAVSAQNVPDYDFYEASDLNLIGKIMDGTPNPYHRVDTCRYKGFSLGENRQVRCPTGMAVLFKTDSRNITVTTRFGWEYYNVQTMPIAYRGYDLYIREKDGWRWAASAATHPSKSESNLTIIANMDGTEHECMLYMPMYSEVYSCRIGVDKGSSMKAMESPFRHRIAFFGSSYTHGISTSRAGMSYPMQFMRSTGLQVLSLGVSGNCKLQPYFATVLEDVQADAFVFDTFSNPTLEQIDKNLMPFVDRMITAHPGVPLIFQRTIYRERRAYDTALEKFEHDRDEQVKSYFDKMKRDKKYKDVYLISPNATSPDHEYSVDGTHPDDHGYALWAKSIEKPLLRILRKYGIR